MDETALAAPLPVLLPCVRGLVSADISLRTAIGASRFVRALVVTARGHDVNVPVPLAVAGPHVSVPTSVGSVASLVTGLASPWTARGHRRGIDGAGVRITGNMGGVVLPRMFTVIIGPV